MSHCSRADIVIRGNIMAVYCLPKSYFVNLFYLFFYPQYAPIHFCELLVCGVSLTHSLGLFKPHLAWHKYIINCHLHWMPLKLESFSREKRRASTTVISTVSVRVAVTSLACAAGIKGPALNRQEWDWTSRSPIRARSCDKLSESDHWPVSRWHL